LQENLVRSLSQKPIISGIKTLHLRAETREDRKAWIDVLLAAKESFLLVGLAQL